MRPSPRVSPPKPSKTMADDAKPLQGKRIIVGVSGGIAAYKTPLLVRLLVKAGAEVMCAVTEHALQFVTELTKLLSPLNVILDWLLFGKDIQYCRRVL